MPRGAPTRPDGPGGTVASAAGSHQPLVESLAERARATGCARLVVATTNDNVDALRFYQRRGFHLIALRPGSIEDARRLKPSIPAVGEHGIPLRDEIELARPL
jgi:N-acetylglutamate synthase-like GNAT family acetyltransferase